MTVPFRAADSARWTSGTLVRGDANATLSGVVIDSRTVRPGQLFVAIVGPNHDAHRFLPQVVAAGAGGVMVARGRAPAGAVAVIEVDDTTAALGALAAGHRADFTGPVIGITGSSGKTTTKEMCAAILEAAGPCLKTEGNLNNEFGLPLTLLRRAPEHERAVIELGMNHRGEIARLAAIARPDVGLVTNVGVAHIEFFGTREEIAREKGDLYAALGPKGIAIANRDDALASAQAERCAGTVLGYSVGGAADVRAEGARFVEPGAFAFELVTPAGSAAVSVAGLGETTVTNALAAATAALAAGAPFEAITRGFSAYRPPSGRMAPYVLPGGATLIDDSYNANPASLRLSLEALVQRKGAGRAIAVLGDMGELGEKEEAAHRDAGRWAVELGVDFLCAVGERAETVVGAAIEAGMDPANAVTAGDTEDATRRVHSRLEPHDWVLVKGSRAMKLERVVASLRAQESR